jgi:hypothetical protein
MVRRWVPALAIALASAACGGDAQDGRDDAVQRDTSIITVPDTMMVERTVTEDTIRNPDLGRDTVRRDTLPR